MLLIRHRHELGPETVAILTGISRNLSALVYQGTKIMSQISDYTDKVNAFVADVKDDLSTISGQATDLKKQITDLQTQIANGSSTLNPADQAAMDDMVSKVSDLADTADTAAGKANNVPPAPTDTTTQQPST